MLRNGMFTFVKYRIHLSIVFALLLYGNNIKLGGTVNFKLLISFLLWHFSLFLFDRIYDRKIDKISQPDEYVKYQYAVKLYILVAIMMLTSLYFYWLSQKPIIYWLYILPITFYRFTRLQFTCLCVYCYVLVLLYSMVTNMSTITIVSMSCGCKVVSICDYDCYCY
jgi:4-hydroxybenzoate polyprenyltransferase